MVDRGRRRTIRNIGIGMGVLLGGGGGASMYGDDVAQRFNAWREEREEAQERRRERHKEQEREQERQETRQHRQRQREQVAGWAEEIQGSLRHELDDPYNWGGAEIATDKVTVTYDEAGTTEENGLIYTFTVTGPIHEESPIQICDYTGDEDDERHLADLLERAATEFHAYLYSSLDHAIPRHQELDELRIVSFTSAFEDESGRASATLDWKTAYDVAQGNAFQPDYWRERTAYTQEYQLAFTTECDA